MSAMLIEIRCDEFKVNGQIRPPIRFHAGLNAVLGDGENSIGKSTLLMIIDFVFGGNDYVDKLKDVHEEIGEHTIEFAFSWGGKHHYFSRNTISKSEVAVCDENYKKLETISTSKFCERLFDGYNLQLPSITLRDVVGRYFRIRKRGNLNENHPLLVVAREKDADAITILIKLFNKYSLIAEYEKKKKAEEEKEKAFKAAQKYEFIPKAITIKQFKDNTKLIGELEEKLISLSLRSTPELLELDAEEASIVAEAKNEYTQARRQRTRLYSKLAAVEHDIAGGIPFDSIDFSELSRFFPGVALKEIKIVSNFHEKLRNVLNNEFKNERENIQGMIALLDVQIAELEKALQKDNKLVRTSKRIFDEYAAVKGEIDKLQALNSRHIEAAELKNSKKALAADLAESKGAQMRLIQSEINSEMRKINEIIQDGLIVPPVLTFKENAAGYHFETPKDAGTGTAFVGLIDFDLGILRLTALPALIHDSFVFKQIAAPTVERIMKLYAEQTNKQIFIEFDRVSTYSQEMVKLLLSPEVKVIELSKQEPLFGRLWNTDDNGNGNIS